MSNDWQEFATYNDVASAESVAGILRSEAVPVQIIRVEPIPGLVDSVRLLVPTGLAHKATWVLSQAKLSDAELDFLATGKLGGTEGK